jgi:hypothetical protein
MEKKNTKFKAGNNGRPKGAVNKTTREFKERVEWVLGLLDQTLEEDLQGMRAAEKVKLWLDLQEFVRPKLQRMNLAVEPGDDNVTKITFEVVRTNQEVAVEKS